MTLELTKFAHAVSESFSPHCRTCTDHDSNQFISRTIVLEHSALTNFSGSGLRRRRTSSMIDPTPISDAPDKCYALAPMDAVRLLVQVRRFWVTD